MSTLHRATLLAFVAMAGACGTPQSLDDAATSPRLLASVRVAPARTLLTVGDTLRLAATVHDDADGGISGGDPRWSTSDSATLAVSPDGLARAVAPGTAFVEARARGGVATVAVTVVAHLDTVTLRPGENLQARVDSAPDGTVFRLTAGTYRGQRVVPKHGMTFIGDSGAVMSGEDSTVVAFDGSVPPYPRNVTIRGLVIERYASPPQFGAVRADAPDGAWTIEACEVRDNAGGGVQLGPRARVLRNHIHHNGQIGVLGGGGDAILVEGNEIAFNNPDAKYDMYWEAGGSKFVRTRDLVVRANFVHHNHGPGLWTDIDNVRALFEDNRVEDNAEAGIFHEIGYTAVIRRNVARRNGTAAVPRDWVSGSGILVSSSSGVEVYDNVVEDNLNGITAIEANRGEGAYGPYVLRDLHVHDNLVRMRTGVTGIATTGIRRYLDRSTYTSRNNRFVANRYRTPAAGRFFRWNTSRLTAEEWRAAGQDTTGEFARLTGLTDARAPATTRAP